MRIVYASTYGYGRRRLWIQIEVVIDMQLPLLLIGDFKYILNESDKKGRRPFQVNRNVRDFRSLLCRKGIIDLGFGGPKFTWCNNRQSGARVWEWIDRVFGFDLWLNMFPEASLMYLSRFASDHHPILLSLNGNLHIHKALFRFEKMQFYYNGIQEIVYQAWHCSNRYSPGVKLTKACQAIIKWKHKIGCI